MINFRLLQLAVVIGTIAVLSACEMGTDDGTRIARAEQSVAKGEYRAAAIELKNVLRSDPSNVQARVMLGKVSLEAGDASAAAKELQRARELGAESRDYAVPLARAMLVLGQADDVLGFRPEDLDSPADRADLNAVRGNALLQKGEIEKAEKSFESALSEQSGHADALVGLARVYLERGELKAAEDALRQVIAQHSDSHAAHSALGRLQMNNAEYPSAEASFRTAIAYSEKPALRREHLTYLAGLVDALLAQKKAGEAQDVAAQMLKLTPDHPYALFQAARADFEAGQLDEVIDKTQRVITEFPDYQPARLLLAAAAMSKENYALAELHLRSLVNADPTNARIRELLAQAQMNMGSPEEAFKALEPLLQDNSASPRLLAMAGSASLRSGDTEKGIEYLTRGLEAGGADPDVQLQAASSFIAAGEIDKAIALLEKMPESMHGEQRDFLLILARLRSGDIEEARAQAARLVKERPDDPVSHRIMGGFHMAVQEIGLARAEFEKVRQIDPTDVGAITNLARLDVMEGNESAARQRYNDLLSQSPGNLVALLGLSQLAEQGGDQPRAVELLEQARVANPTAVQPVLLLARFYLRTKKPDLAAERAAQALAISPNSVDAINLVGQIELETNRYSEALGTFERALKQEPNRFETHFFLAQAQLKLGMNEAGRKSLEKTIELNPTHLGARIALTRMESLLGNFSAALKIAEGLKDEFPDRAEPLALEGDIHIMRGHFNDAIDAYDAAAKILPNEIVTLKRFEARQRAGRADSHKVLEEWLEREPDNVKVRTALAEAYQSNGLVEKAIAEYQSVLARQSDNVVALNNLAWLYAELGGADNLRRGVEIAAQANKLLPEVGQVTDTYGWLLLKQGRVNEAAEKLRLAMSQAPDDPDIRYHLAVALQRSGGAVEARDLLDAILTDGSSFSSRDEAKALRDKL